MKIRMLGAALVGCMTVAGAATAQPAAPAAAPAPPPPYGAPLTGEQAQQAINAAEADARRNNWSLAFAVVDTYGELVAAKRMTGAPPFTVEVARRKARASAVFRAPSSVMAANAAMIMQLLPEIAPVEGAVPIVVDGRVVGAIGASGAASGQDLQAAKSGAAAVR